MTKPKNFLTAEWRNLIMLNFEVDPVLLRPYIPRSTELDFWDGKTLVSIVGFQFLKTRVYGLAIPFHKDFEEINLRFYVKYNCQGAWRRGVVFIKEIVPKPAIALVARWQYNENYVSLPMRHRLFGHPEQGDFSVRYGWYAQNRWHELSVTTNGEWQALKENSEEEFITNHSWGYVTQKDGSCLEYEVEHPQWKVRMAQSVSFDCDVEETYGKEFSKSLQPSRLRAAFLAQGSPVIVKRGIRI